MVDDTEQYRESTPRSAKLFERAARHMPGGDTREVTYHEPYPSFVEEASGYTMTTADGEKLLDFLNNYTQAVLGHTPKPVVEAVCERFRKGSGVAAPTRHATELAERLCERVPSVDLIRFANSGTEATMNAIRAAIAYTERDGVLKVRGGFHGTHDTVLVGVSGEGRENLGIPRNVEDRVSTVRYNDIEALKAAFERRGDDLACFIVEPLMGHGGMIPATAEYLEAARDLADETETVLVFDEVMSFRLAPGGAQERFGVRPDLTAFGKFVGGGTPAGAFGGRQDLMSVFDPEKGSVNHSGTFNGNPASMVGGLATLDALDADTIERINALGSRARERLTSASEDADVPVQVVGMGSLFNVHFTEEPVTNYANSTADEEITRQLFLAMRNRGVMLAPRGMGNVSTPMSEAQIDTLVETFERALTTLDRDAA